MKASGDQIAYEHTRYLVEECGERIAGSPEMDKAISYVKEVFDSIGMEKITASFNVPRCITKKSRIAAQIGDEWVEIDHTNICFSKDTPEDGITAQAVYIPCEKYSMGLIGEIYPLKEEQLGEKVKDRIVILGRNILMDYPDIDTYKLLEKYHALAVIFTTSEEQKGIPYVYANYETSKETYMIPSFVIHDKDARKLAAMDQIKLHLELETEILECESQNVIGVLQGTDWKNEIVMVSGHLDSAVSSKGAVDDAGAIGTVLALAKQYKELWDAGIKPRRTMYFVCWSGHEPGLHGSKYFIQNNPDIYRRLRFNLNYDIIGIPTPIGATYSGIKEHEKWIRESVEKQGYDWGIFSGPVPCDTMNITSREVPSITLSASGVDFCHTPNDAMDKIKKEGFREVLGFSKSFLDLLDQQDEIPQKYEKEIKEQVQIYAHRYKWDF
ncbi:MAG: M28 family peptidase [Clostridiaceae bacterium]|nr:M28 family peptidase [Clostridiaceae bacterium]